MGRAKRGQSRQAGGRIDEMAKNSLRKKLFAVFNSLSPLPQFLYGLKKIGGENIYWSIIITAQLLENMSLMRAQNFLEVLVFFLIADQNQNSLHCSLGVFRFPDSATVIHFPNIPFNLCSWQTPWCPGAALTYLGFCDFEAVPHKALKLGLEFRQLPSLK